MKFASDKTLYRDTAFSYHCNSCRSCCVHQRIQVNPYEMLRLARNQGLSGYEFALRHIEREGPYLAVNDDGSCVFLTTQGCSVHPDRPLACRVYPLGRFVSGRGEETFRELVPTPNSEGVYGNNGTVETFLAEQGALPFIRAADQYQALFNRLYSALQDILPSDEQLAADAQATLFQRQNDDLPAFMEWLDAESAVMAYCQSQGTDCPDDVDGIVRWHIESIETWLSRQRGESP